MRCHIKNKLFVSFVVHMLYQCQSHDIIRIFITCYLTVFSIEKEGSPRMLVMDTFKLIKLER